jgi:hypothetical protein
LTAGDSLSLELGLVLNLFNITLGLKGERPVASKALRIVVSFERGLPGSVEEWKEVLLAPLHKACDLV